MDSPAMPGAPAGFSRAAQPVVVSDLDGTLLELHTYDCAASRAGVHALQQAGIPLVFCSSKTRAEQVYYQHLLGLRAPLIVENGSAVFIPDGYFSFEIAADRTGDGYVVLLLGMPVDELRRRMAVAADAAGITYRGYADWPLGAIMRRTGLDEAAAHRACAREYSETILEVDVAPETAAFGRFTAALHQQGLLCLRGSRFYTVTGAGADKGRATERLIGLFGRQYGALITVGVGDGPNDAPMLAAVDRPCLVQRPDGSWADVDTPGVRRIDGIGPAGWRQVVSELLRARGTADQG